MAKRSKPIYPKRIWSVEDKMFLRQNYNSMPMPEIMEHLRRTDDAIHWMASHLGLTGHRYSVNNHLAGKSYTKKGSGTSLKVRGKKIKTNTVTEAIRGRKRKKKGHRWCDQKLASKPFATEGKKTVRIDHKTVIYVPSCLSETEIAAIVAKYKKTT